MSNVALAVGVSISGTFVLIIAGVVILICVLNKRNPGRRARGLKNTTTVRNVKKGTKNSKRKAEELKADQSKCSCCVMMACCSGRRSDGPFPDPPFGVELQDATASEITVTWNAPETEKQTVTILGYNIYKRLKSNSDDWTKVGKVTTGKLEVRVRSLVPNKRYVFGVSSKGKTGDSTIVETQPITLKSDPVRPGAPAEFDATDKTCKSITLSWKPPRKTGYSRIHTYYLMMKDCESNADWAHLTALPAFDRFMDYKVTGLQPKHLYRFRVNAQNIAGLGPYAETVTLETSDIEPEPPGKPNGPIKYARISHNSITLSWRLQEQDGGKPVSGFAVEYKEIRSKGWHKAGVCEADKTRLTVSRLQEDIEYIFRVIAMNIVGNSKPLVGAKIKTKLLEIPLSRRSSFQLPSPAETKRVLSGGKSSAKDTLGEDLNRALTNLEGTTSQTKLEGLDPQLEADPFVPKSDFFTYDETNSGNISNRHGENKTCHSQFSPLPAPPPSQSTKPSGATQTGRKHRHSEISPLPRPQSYQYTNGRLRQSGESYTSSDDDDDENNYDDDGNTNQNISGELSNFKRPGGVVRHQPTPSNISYAHSRF